MLVFPGVFGRGRFSELWGFLMICWGPAVGSWGCVQLYFRFGRACIQVCFEKACYANKPTNNGRLIIAKKARGEFLRQAVVLQGSEHQVQWFFGSEVKDIKSGGGCKLTSMNGRIHETYTCMYKEKVIPTYTH